MARHEGGWVKLHRKIEESDIAHNFLLLGLWTTLLKWANWKESRVTWRGLPRELERGELLTSVKELAAFGGVDRRTVDKWLKYLIARDSIVVEKSPRGSHLGIIIKIKNYEKYNSLDAERSHEHVHETVHEHANEGRTYKEGKKVRTSRAGSARLQEARFRLAKEIDEIKPILAAMFDNVLPKSIESRIPDILMAADGNVETVKNVLEDLYQSPKIRTGEGLGGNKSSYVTAAILGRFGISGEAS